MALPDVLGACYCYLLPTYTYMCTYMHVHICIYIYIRSAGASIHVVEVFVHVCVARIYIYIYSHRCNAIPHTTAVDTYRELCGPWQLVPAMADSSAFCAEPHAADLIRGWKAMNLPQDWRFDCHA